MKFRVWNKKEKDWCDGHYLLSQDGEMFFATSYECVTVSDYEMRDLVLMGCTEIEDVHGKDVYEGDIVGIYSGNMWMEGVIRYDKELGAYKIQPYHQSLDEFNMEVIGNIYENPELVEGLE